MQDALRRKVMEVMLITAVQKNDLESVQVRACVRVTCFFCLCWRKGKEGEENRACAHDWGRPECVGGDAATRSWWGGATYASEPPAGPQAVLNQAHTQPPLTHPQKLVRGEVRVSSNVLSFSGYTGFATDDNGLKALAVVLRVRATGLWGCGVVRG